MDYANCISAFLGERIISHPVVQNSKLSENEFQSLDRPLTVEELDASVAKRNVRSAPGIDGLNNLFIKKYWDYLRVPLLNYANCCFDLGKLTTNFRLAAIKLIPKKGPNDQIKNWRPISLLSNMYKIVSRAINARLNVIVNRVLTCAKRV